LPSSLVLFRLLAEQGDQAQLVVGLPRPRNHHDAHAWLELDGVQLGPAPTVERHDELARYG
jgi:Transglutaminase-like superfamily